MLVSKQACINVLSSGGNTGNFIFALPLSDWHYLHNVSGMLKQVHHI